MNNPLGVSPSKGNQEPHEAKKKSFDLGGNRTHDFKTWSFLGLVVTIMSSKTNIKDYQ